MRIGVIEIHVDDQERAWAFYTDVLGFTVVDGCRVQRPEVANGRRPQRCGRTGDCCCRR